MDEHDAAHHAHEAAHGVPFLAEILVLLAAGLAAAALCRRLKMSPVIGYLAAGVVLGPGGVGLVRDAADLQAIAELGVIFLLFSIGLELSLERLRALRTYIFGLGAAQMGVTATIIAGLAYVLTGSVTAAALLGVAFAFSSTAVAMQLLTEQRDLTTSVGRVAFAVLLFQDLAVAPALLLVQILAESDGGVRGVVLAAGEALLRAVLAVAVILVVGRFVARRVFRVIARERSADLFMGLVVLAALSTAWATQEAGLSAVLGAFLAGVLLAETEFRAQIETDVEPFKGLLLGLFFISVGMSIDPALIVRDPLVLLAAVIGLAALKSAIIIMLAWAFKRPTGEAVRIGLLLSQAGEFGFVLVGAALVAGLVPGEAAQFASLVIGGSMLASPLFDMLGRAIASHMGQPKTQGSFAVETAAGHVILTGYGRVGRLVGQALEASGSEWVGVERDASLVQAAMQEGAPILFGDAARVELLERAGLQNASALVITLDDPIAVERTLQAVRSRRPELPIIVRARDASAGPHLQAAGAHSVIFESLEPALQMATEALTIIGASTKDVASVTEALRSHVDPGRVERSGAGDEPDASPSADKPDAVKRSA